MRNHIFLLVMAWGLAVVAAAHAEEPAPAPKPELKDGDIVAFIGNGFFEREGRYGYIETALTARYADRDIKFRNLGWSGDTVWCESRAYFGTPEDGFKHLLEHVDIVKPTVIILNYGGNEAFAGPEGLPNFIKGYERLLDELGKRTKRIILFSPIAVQVQQGPMDRDMNLRVYAHAIADLATQRNYSFLNLLELEPPHPILTGTIDPLQIPLRKIEGHDVEIRRWVSEESITVHPVYASFFSGWIQASFLGGTDLLSQGRAAYFVDRAKSQADRTGKEDIFEKLRSSYDHLRTAIVEKNTLFFHRHRPQNETYLRGFRKHEQGNNAAEILEFEKLVAEKEQEIAKLRRELLETIKKEGAK